MRYFEVNGLDASRRVGYGQFNTDHTATIDLFDTEEEKMEHMRGMYKTSPKAFAEWKEWCMYVHLLTDIFGTLEILKNLMKKNYLLKTKTYFFYIIYTFILILNRHHYYLINFIYY